MLFLYENDFFWRLRCFPGVDTCRLHFCCSECLWIYMAWLFRSPSLPPQVGYWPRRLRLASPAPQKITPWHPFQTVIAIIAKLSIFSWFVKSFIFVLLAFLKCFISSTSVFTFMKDSNFFFRIRQLKSKVFICTDIFLLPDRSLTHVLHMLSASFIWSLYLVFSFPVPPTQGGSGKRHQDMLFTVVTVSSHTTITSQLKISVFE